MATTLSYSLSAFTPFTVIRSSDVNTYFTDIRSRVNWAGGSSTTTGLGDDNLQSNTVSGGGLTRSTKIKLGTAYAVVVNSSTGALGELTPVANGAVYFNGSGQPAAGSLPTASGGTGSSITSLTPGFTLVVNQAGTAFVASPASSNNPLFNFHNLA